MTFPDGAVLIVEGGPESGRTIPLAGGTTTLGRLRDNDILVDQPGVADHHAEVSTEVSYYLTDLSANGIIVNGERPTEGVHLLDDGDTFSLGPSEVLFVFPSRNKAVLVVEGGAESGRRVPLGGGTTTFGRASDNDVVVDHRQVSRRHAEISTDVAYYLTDLSGEGTFVNGAKLDQGVHLLRDADTFSIGTGDVTVPVPQSHGRHNDNPSSPSLAPATPAKGGPSGLGRRSPCL